MSSRPQTTAALLARLGGPAPESEPDGSRRAEPTPPWYLWAISGLGALAAGAMAIMAVGLALIQLGVPPDGGALVAGPVFLGLAVGLDRWQRDRASLFVHSLVLTLAVGGGMLTIGGLWVASGSMIAAAVALWLLTAATVPLLRAPLLGFLGVLGAMSLTFGALLVDVGLPTATMQSLPLVLVTVAAVAGGVALLLAPPRRPPDPQPAAIALLLTPPPILAAAEMLSPLALGGAAAYAVAALGIVWTLTRPAAWMALALPVVAAAALSPGAAAGLLMLILAYRLGNRILAALGLLGLLGAVVHVYYVLDVSLLAKSGVLALGGLITLGAWALLRPAGSRTSGNPDSPGALRPAGGKRRAAGLAAGLILIAALFGWRITTMETLLAEGTEVHVALAPLDPRSIMQGDYMALAFDQRLLPPGLPVYDLPRRGVLVVTRDPMTLEARGRRLHDGSEALHPDEMLLAFRTSNQRLIIGADSFLFQEGTGDDHANATHGILRVGADGTALLVGLR